MGGILAAPVAGVVSGFESPEGGVGGVGCVGVGVAFEDAAGSSGAGSSPTGTPLPVPLAGVSVPFWGFVDVGLPDMEKKAGRALDKEEKKPDPVLCTNADRGFEFSGVDSFDWYDVTPTFAISFTT